MKTAPDFKRADDALETAVEALPLAACAEADAALRQEYLAMVLALLHTKERIARLGEAWNELAQAAPRGCA